MARGGRGEAGDWIGWCGEGGVWRGICLGGIKANPGGGRDLRVARRGGSGPDYWGGWGLKFEAGAEGETAEAFVDQHGGGDARWGEHGGVVYVFAHLDRVGEAEA